MEVFFGNFARILLSSFGTISVDANSVCLDQMLLSAFSDTNLYCLQRSCYWTLGINGCFR